MSLRHLAICLLLVVLPFSRSRLAAEELPVWTSIGPYGGSVHTLAVSPVRPDLVLAGLQQGYGIYRSTDRSKSWGAATDTFGQSVLDFAIDARGRAFYAAGFQGLFKSTDGGIRWNELDNGRQGTYTFVATHPSKAPLVFATWGGVFLRSPDGGVTREVVEGPQWVATMAFVPAGRRTVIYAGAVNGLWKSVDDGRTWTTVSLPFPSPPNVEVIAVDPVDARILYMGLRQGNQRALLKSLDGGATWRRLSLRGLPEEPPGVVWAVTGLAVDRTKPSVVYAIVGGELFRSVNGGLVWSRPAPGLPGGSVTDLETTGYGVLASTPEGVLLSVDRGLTWQVRTTGMAATSISGMAIDHQEPARLYASVASAGLFKTANQGRSWLRLGNVAPPPVFDRPLAIDPTDPNIVLAGADYGIGKSTNGGRRWAVQNTFFCQALTRIAFDPREPSRLFASGQLLTFCVDPSICLFYRSQDAGETWTCLGFARDPITFLGIEPFTSAVYVQSFSRSFSRSTDGGQTWTRLGEGGFTSFAASPLVEGTLWAGRPGGVVERSRDGGVTWQPFVAGLPTDDPVAALAPDPADPATLYGATARSGVFKSTDAGETWSLAGLWPTGAFYQAGLLVDPGEPGVVYAGTNSLGVLRLYQTGLLPLR